MVKRKHEQVQEEDTDYSSECETINETFSDEDHHITPKRVAKNEDWIQKYAPVVSQDICIHPRKLKEVSDTLSQMLFHQSEYKLLILSGPAGSSKSTTVKILAKELLSNAATGGGLDTYTETGVDQLNLRPPESWIEYLDEAGDMAQSCRFLEFLEDARYRTGDNKCVVIVEELPNVFHKGTLENFRRAILEWIYSDSSANLPPLVLCITEVETLGSQDRDYFSLDNNLTVETLLGKEIVNAKDRVKRINFNPLARTYLKKSLGKIVATESALFNKIGSSDLKQFMDQILECGDIRSATANLQFWSSLHLKQGQENYNYLRENQLGLFHALGKIIFSSSKYKELEAEELDFNSVELVLSSYGNTSLLLLALLENYHVVSGLNYSISSAALITNALSESDCMPIFEGKEYGIRSTRNELRKVQSQRTSSRALNLQFPRQYKMTRAYNRVFKEVQEYREVVCHMKTSFLDLNMIDGYFVPRIYNSFRYKLKNERRPLEYNRLGGKFKEVYSDTAALVDDVEYSETIKDQFRKDIEDGSGNKDSESDMSDPISESDQSDDFLSDSDLDGLISQGVV